MIVPTASARSVAFIHSAVRTLQGDGFEVRRAIPALDFEAVGPFIFLDHFGPIHVKAGEAKGASAHPHAGIETPSRNAPISASKRPWKKLVQLPQLGHQPRNGAAAIWNALGVWLLRRAFRKSRHSFCF